MASLTRKEEQVRKQRVISTRTGETHLKRSNALLDAVVVDAEYDEVVPADLLNVVLVCNSQRAAGKHALVDRTRRISRVICACDGPKNLCIQPAGREKKKEESRDSP